MNLDSIKSEGAARLEQAGQAARRGAKSVGRGAGLVRQRAVDHPYLSAALGVTLAGVGWALLSNARRQQRQRRLAVGLAALAGALHTLSRGKLSRGMAGASKVGKELRRWGKNQKLGSFARDSVGPALQALVPMVVTRLMAARRRLS